MFPEYKTQEHDQYGDILIINGKESICHFKSSIAVPVQNALGQMSMQIMNFPCCTACPHAHIEKLGLDDQTTYTISCTGVENSFEITENNDFLKIIS